MFTRKFYNITVELKIYIYNSYSYRLPNACFHLTRKKVFLKLFYKIEGLMEW